jgi:hypothetical protein
METKYSKRVGTPASNIKCLGPNPNYSKAEHLLKDEKDVKIIILCSQRVKDSSMKASEIYFHLDIGMLAVYNLLCIRISIKFIAQKFPSQFIFTGLRTSI